MAPTITLYHQEHRTACLYGASHEDVKTFYKDIEHYYAYVRSVLQKHGYELNVALDGGSGECWSAGGDCGDGMSGLDWGMQRAIADVKDFWDWY